MCMNEYLLVCVRLRIDLIPLDRESLFAAREVTLTGKLSVSKMTFKISYSLS